MSGENMTEKVPKEKLINFFKILKTIYAVKDSIKSLSINHTPEGIKGAYYGEEAVSTGVCAALKETDIVINAYDGISNLIARGSSIKNIFAEILGKSGGYNNGVRGYLNITVPELGVYSANSFSNTSVALSTGFALAGKIKGENKVIAAFYDNNTSNEGIIHETMNIASAFKLPVLFICENRIGIEDGKFDELVNNGNFSKRSIGYGIKGYSVNGMDVSAVYHLANKTIDDIRDDNHPVIIECITKFYYDNFKEIDNKSDSKNILNGKSLVTSLVLDDFVKMLLDSGTLTHGEMKHFEEKISILVSEALEFAKNSKELEPGILKSLMYADKYLNIPKPGWLS